ncbi:MlaD family protein [Nocardia stercoris]|uniref:MCE family protein n=1 Tax=Nocardia stercoris TaxID=2483361 RepID=A0A3M2LAL5_9NOCA|nr:MCE family protein [Nocardia stercoris]RMI34066.1 MCE family protein [Nocardia stercoris]
MIIDPSGRGPTMRQLYVAGVCGLTVCALILGLLFARYKGYILHPKVDVTANLTTTGDGLPSNADVKFRGVLVGAVHDVTVAAKGEIQQVHIEMKPQYVGGVPANVTARVVPSNLFAVTSVELVYNGPSDQYLHAGSQIEEDKSKGTIALQDTLTTIRKIFDKLDPIQLGRVLGTLSYALDGNGRMPGSTLDRLDEWLTQVRAAVPDADQTFSDFASSFRALNQSAPDLMDTLKSSIKTAQTVSDKRQELVALLTGAMDTTDRVNDLFARNNDTGKVLTVGLGDMFGNLTADPAAIPATIANMNNSLRKLNTTFHWGPQRQMIWNAGATLTPWLPYTNADCPHYGNLAAPSCATAPSVADPGVLPDSLRPHALAAAQGLPPALPMAGLPDGFGQAPAEPAAPGAPANPLAGSPLAGLFPWLNGPAPAPTPAPAGNPNPATPGDAPAAGPVVAPAGDIAAAAPGIYSGDAAVLAFLGRRPNTAEYLLLSSILRGGTLQVTDSGAGR